MSKKYYSINGIIEQDNPLMDEATLSKPADKWIFLESSLTHTMLNYSEDPAKSIESILYFPDIVSTIPERIKRDVLNDPVFLNVLETSLTLAPENKAVIIKSWICKIYIKLLKYQTRLTKIDTFTEFMEKLLGYESGLYKSIIASANEENSEEELMDLCVLFTAYVNNINSLLNELKNYYTHKNKPIPYSSLALLMKYNTKKNGGDLLHIIFFIMQNEEYYSYFYRVLLVMLDTYITMDQLYYVYQQCSFDNNLLDKMKYMIYDNNSTGLLKMIVI